jgi:hypothetical protein
MFLGAFKKLRKATINFVLSVCLSAHMKKLCSHWTDYHEIWYLSIYQKSTEKIQAISNTDKNNGITGALHSDQYTFI